MLIGRKSIGTVGYLGGLMAIPEPFLKSWSDMLQYNSEYFMQQTERIIYTRATVSYHSFARNALVEHMQGEWLLMLDTDITFDPDIVARMINQLERFNIDVLVAPYLYKSPPHPPVLYGYNPKTKAKFILGNWDKTADLIPLRSAGAGCLLVRKRVFQRIQAELHQSPFDIYFDKKVPLSEDHSFFERCWKLKIPVYASPVIFVKHLMYKELDVEKDYDRKSVRIDKVKIFNLKPS